MTTRALKTTITRPALRNVESRLKVKPRQLGEGYSLSRLKNKWFKKPEFYVDEILLNGLTILAGRPKKGKSWLSLAMLMDITRGAETFGMLKTKKCNAIYYDLEGNPRRLKERALKLLEDGSEWPEGLFVYHTLSRLGDGCEAEIERAVRKHDAKVVVIDTLTPIKGDMAKGQDPYRFDYDQMAILQLLAHRLGIAIKLVYHTRKAASDDPQDQIMGSTGTTAAVDSWFVLIVNAGGVSLHGAGRDIEPVDWTLDQVGPRLVISGDAKERRKSKQSLEILQLLKRRGELTNEEIAKDLGRDQGAVNKLLHDMRGRGHIVRVGYGRYALPA